MTKSNSIWRRHQAPWMTSALLGVFCVLLLTFQGLACPVFIEMFKDFGIEFKWPHKILYFVHWQWTLPVSMIFAGLIVWKVKQVTKRINKFIDLILLLLLLLQAGVGIWMTFCFRITK